MLHVVTGGSGSGKSAFAEEMACKYHRQNPDGTLLYIATMIPYGEETKKKIKRHQNLRAGKGFQTMECYTELEKNVEQKLGTPDTAGKHVSCVLLECMSNLVANEVFCEENGVDEVNVDVARQILRGIQALQSVSKHVVIVTNEVFQEPLQPSKEMQHYKKVLAEVNGKLANAADVVTEVVYGIPGTVKTDRRNKMNFQRNDGVKGAGSMRLIIGGSYQGKLEFAKKLFPKLRWIDGAVCPLDAVESCEGIYHFHEYVKRWIQSGKDNENIAETMAAQLHERNPDIVIVSDEIGYGLVPVDAFERNYRETTGRICTELAGYACEVYRVICGIGILIKEGRTNEDGTGTGIAGRD